MSISIQNLNASGIGTSSTICVNAILKILFYPPKLCAISSLSKNRIGGQKGFTQNSKRVHFPTFNSVTGLF